MLQGSAGHPWPLRLLVATTAAVLLACGKSTELLPTPANSAPAPAQVSIAASTSRLNPPATSWEARQQYTDVVLAWYAAMRDDPDPTMRLLVVEGWTQHQDPDDKLDLLTHALVDPDDAVRARAQELFEQELTRP